MCCGDSVKVVGEPAAIKASGSLVAATRPGRTSLRKKRPVKRGGMTGMGSAALRAPTFAQVQRGGRLRSLGLTPTGL